jgi:LysR family transcriptional regulator, glycine cleavage system transcriptional activator
MSRDSQALRRTIPSLHSLIIFEAAARYLNFSKAAAELSVTQPAVSHGIRQLEAALGHSLFIRESRALVLTTQGQRLFEAVSGGFASIAETVDDIVGTPQAETLVISTSTVMATEWLMPRISRFRARHPDLLIDLRCLDRDPDLTANNIDLHLRLGDGNWPGCDAALLWPEEITPVCSPDYLRKTGPINTLTDLLSRDLVHYIDPYRFRIGWAEWFRACGIGVPPTIPASLQVNDSLVAMRAAENGEGIALGWPPVINRSLAEGRLTVACAKTVTTKRHFYAVTATPPNRRRLAVIMLEWLVEQAKVP